MTEIHLFRHGQTEWNLTGRMQGFKDSPLTALGQQQALEARGKVDGVVFDAAYSSTTSRAYDTAKLLLDSAILDVTQLDDLREINMGVWEGMQREEVEKHYAADYHSFWQQPSQFSAEGAETFLSLQTRGVKVLKQIAKHHDKETVLVVSHAGFIKTVLTALLGHPLDDLWNEPFAGNLSHSILKADSKGELKVVQFCDEKQNVIAAI
ncbi:histidine phosphatase family protein [Thaumasiovibrio subtropicus]|uniref:histidine phosphatase family protein n=1 Tax=Thaumasiovibrio subtropicus TaxID=1891207 RepID=UPI000B353413|nr:histidine phosphatase family protein [Thaumasiovibrio subtropicus]